MKQNRYQCRYYSKANTGFTLVELMLGMALSAMVIVMIATAYWTQTHSSRSEMEKVGLQQNMRTAMFFMQRDLMMAGYDHNIDDTGTTPTFTFAGLAGGNPQLSFQYNAGEDGIDNDADGQTDEANETEQIITIQYRLFDSAADADATVDDLQRQPGGQAIAGNIDAMEFVYSIAPAGGGAATTIVCPPNNVPAGSLNRIQAVGVTLLARTENAVHSGSPNNRTYTSLSGLNNWQFNDGFQRQVVTSWILCRNMINN